MGMNSEIAGIGFIDGYLTAMKEMGNDVDKDHLTAIALEYICKEENPYYASEIERIIKSVSEKHS